MLCMSCWKEIRDDTAVYTKSCKHVFCQSCSDKAFTSSSSACPRCGNLLPRKEGTATLTLHPSDSHVARIAAQAFGFAPRDLCAVLQKALDFSAQQAANDALKYVHQVSALKQKLEHLAKEHTKVVKALDEERLKKSNLAAENKTLQKMVADLEAKSADKSRSIRKLKESYMQLRGVHKRLENDLQCARDNDAPSDKELDGDDDVADAAPVPSTLMKPLEHGTGRTRDRQREQRSRARAMEVEQHEREREREKERERERERERDGQRQREPIWKHSNAVARAATTESVLPRQVTDSHATRAAHHRRRRTSASPHHARRHHRTATDVRNANANANVNASMFDLSAAAGPAPSQLDAYSSYRPRRHRAEHSHRNRSVDRFP